MFFREREAKERARDRVEERRRRGGQRRKLYHRPPPAIGIRAKEAQKRLEKGVEHAEGKGGAQVEPDALHQQRQQRRQRQRAQQIVQQFQPRKPGKAAAEEKGQKLPVAARPAVEALEVGGERLREAVEKGDVAGEGRPGQFALDEVVAEDAALGQLALHRRHEGAHVVDALAAKIAAAGQILIEIGDGDRVGVHAAVAGKEADEAVFDRGGG